MKLAIARFMLGLTVATFFAEAAVADIVVIANSANPAKSMTREQVADLYLGRARTFASGEYALVFDQARGAGLRDRYFKALTGMSPTQVNAYWSRLMFTGQVLPPQPLPDDKAVIEIVRRNPGAIGYIESTSLDGSVRAVLTLKE